MFCSICQLRAQERILHWVKMVCDHIYRILATTPVPGLNGAFEGSDREILWKGHFEEPLEHIDYLLVRQILLGITNVNCGFGGVNDNANPMVSLLVRTAPYHDIDCKTKPFKASTFKLIIKP